MSASLWSVGRSESSGAGSHWRQVRNCIDCTSSGIVLSGEHRVPKLNRRSHGVLVSEMPIEEEEEEEIDEDASIDGLEDVEKFINEDDESDFTLDEDEVPRGAADCVETKRQEMSKERLRRGFWKTVEIDGDFRNEEIPRGSGRAETDKEVQSMWTCGTLGERMSAIIVARSQRSQSWKKNEQFPKKTGREAYFCDWSPRIEPRFHCFFERHGSVSDRIRRRREQRCSLLEKARQLKLERNRVCGEFETMLNSFPGKELSTLAVQR